MTVRHHKTSTSHGAYGRRLPNASYHLTGVVALIVQSVSDRRDSSPAELHDIVGGLHNAIFCTPRSWDDSWVRTFTRTIFSASAFGLCIEPLNAPRHKKNAHPYCCGMRIHIKTYQAIPAVAAFSKRPSRHFFSLSTTTAVGCT